MAWGRGVAGIQEVPVLAHHSLQPPLVEGREDILTPMGWPVEHPAEWQGFVWPNEDRE